MEAQGGRVAWIATSPVKGLRLTLRDERCSSGRGSRATACSTSSMRRVGSRTRSARVGSLRASAETDGELLRVRLPDGAAVDGEVELGDTVETNFYGRPVRGRVVRGPWAEALSAIAGLPLTLVRAEEPGSGLDRGAEAAASLVSTAALEALARAAGVDGPVDGRRFRMNLGVDGITAHEEDGWLGRPVARR